MPDDTPFLRTILDHPHDVGPRLVFADWLEERGDPWGEFLALMPEIVKAIKALPSSPGAHYGERKNGIERLRSNPQRRLFASLQSRYTPMSDGRVVGDLQTDVRSQQYVTAVALHAAGLVTGDDLVARAARAAVAAHASWADGAAGASWAAWSTGAAEAAGIAWTQAYRWQLNLATWLQSSNTLPTQARRLLRTIHAGVHA